MTQAQKTDQPQKTDYGEVTLFDYHPAPDDFRQAVTKGLEKNPKQIPAKFLYDECGAQLFEAITKLDEYYITETELGILRDNIDEVTGLIGPRARLVELGSGSGNKTRVMLDNLDDPAGYVPLDISREQLIASSQVLSLFYPELEILPLCADYTGSFEIPEPETEPERTVLYFPGSTIGNFEPEEAVQFLTKMRQQILPDGGLLLGVDLQKPAELVEPAYNDPAGVTAAFNRNLLARVNRELGADFDLSKFHHNAVYTNSGPYKRIEMRLVSDEDQTVHIGDRDFRFSEGDYISTENSYKFTLSEFRELAERAGLEVYQVWTDDDEHFSVQCLRVKSRGG